MFKLKAPSRRPQECSRANIRHQPEVTLAPPSGVAAQPLKALLKPDVESDATLGIKAEEHKIHPGVPPQGLTLAKQQRAAAGGARKHDASVWHHHAAGERRIAPGRVRVDQAVNGTGERVQAQGHGAGRARQEGSARNRGLEQHHRHRDYLSVWGTATAEQARGHTLFHLLAQPLVELHSFGGQRAAQSARQPRLGQAA